MSLSTIAKAIWDKLGENDRANSATTISVVKCKDGEMYCTSNDVSQISAEAIAEAKKQGIAKIGDDYISRSGAGFHAEMWSVIHALHADTRVLNVLTSVGASRPCCKNCTAVLKFYGVAIEQESQDQYGSWYNPMTVNERCLPREGFARNQKRDIPDFRNFSTDYWFTSQDGQKFQKVPPVTAT